MTINPKDVFPGARFIYQFNSCYECGGQSPDKNGLIVEILEVYSIPSPSIPRYRAALYYPNTLRKKYGRWALTLHHLAPLEITPEAISKICLNRAKQM